MEYKIIFDTQAIRNDPEKADLKKVFSSNVSNVIEFLKQNSVTNVKLCIPELVIAECIQQKNEVAKGNIEKFNQLAGRLKFLGYEVEPVKVEENYTSIFGKAISDFTSQNSIEVIKIPEINSQKLIDRAIKKVKPFDDKSSGFKDTVLLFSIMEDAEIAGQKHYILVSGNTTDFTPEVLKQFKETTKKELSLAIDIESLKVLLDELLPLRLKLQSLHKEIREGITERTGSITRELNKTISRNSFINKAIFPVGGSVADPIALSYGSAIGYMGYEGYGGIPIYGNAENRIMGYDFSEIDIKNVSNSYGMGADKFRVEGILVVNVIREELQPMNVTRPFFNRADLVKAFNFELDYDKASKDILAISFRELSPLG